MNSLEIFWILLIYCGHLGFMRTFWIVSLCIFALLFKMPKNKRLMSSLSCKDSMSYLDSSKLGVAVVYAEFFFSHILNLFTYSTNQDQLSHLTQYNIGIIEVVICPLRTSSTGSPTWLGCDGSGSLHYDPGRIFELVDSTSPLLEDSLRYYLLD